MHLVDGVMESLGRRQGEKNNKKEMDVFGGEAIGLVLLLMRDEIGRMKMI